MASKKRALTGVNRDGTRGGFTIIEVVLVLAIAGLIFLMVFIAFPALQRAQRDTQRRSDLGRLATMIGQYQTNNNGRLPADGSVNSIEDVDGVVAMSNYASTTNSAENIIKNYMNGAGAVNNEFTDPAGAAYGLTIQTFAGAMPTLDFNSKMIYLLKKAQCDGEQAVSSSNSRDYAIVYKLEGSGTFCQSNAG